MAAHRRARSTTRARAGRAALAAVLLLAAPASAHSGHRSFCSARTVPGGLDVTVQVPVVQLVENADGTRAPSDDAAILAAGPRYRQTLEGHVRATTPAGECAVISSGPRLEGTAERRAVFELAFTCPSGPITLGSDYQQDLSAQAEMVCALDGNAHVFRQGALDRLVGTPPSSSSVLVGFAALGVEHVLLGLDHVLFVLALLFGAASAMRAEPGRALRRVVGLVTGFTLGHSVTLALAALGVLALPSRFTESMIALSIVIVAVHDLLAENPRGLGALSAVFGLIHGFGFAAVLAEIGLPRAGAVPALLAFNVGIELAQLALVVTCFPALAWARRQAWFRKRLLVPACGAIAALASVWFIERAFDVQLLPWLGA